MMEFAKAYYRQVVMKIVFLIEMNKQEKALFFQKLFQTLLKHFIVQLNYVGRIKPELMFKKLI